MSNNVTNRVRIGGPTIDVEGFIAAHMRPTKHGRHLDFNTVIPQPADLNPESSSIAEDGALLLVLRNLNSVGGLLGRAGPVDLGVAVGWSDGSLDRWRERMDQLGPQWREVAAAWLMSVAKYGYGSWYEWCSENWGTKWNSYSSSDTLIADATGERSILVLVFDTANASPVPIFEKLSEIWPTLLIGVMAFDEGWNFACRGGFLAGKGELGRVPATREMYELVYGEPPESEEEDD